MENIAKLPRDHLIRKWLEIKLVLKKKVKFTYITAGALLVVSANSVNVGETGNLKKVKKKKSQNLEKPAGQAKQKHPPLPA